MEFEYHDSFDGCYMKYLGMRTGSCLCKHVCRVMDDRTRALLEASERIGYTHVTWGYGECLHTDTECNRLVQISRIQTFIYNGFVRPIRLVIDRDGDIWIDNLHSAITHMLCRGTDITLGSMPVYIIDMRHSVPVIMDGYHLIEFDRVKIGRMLTVSRHRCERVSSEIKAIRYTMEDFMKDNDITRNALTISPGCYEDYIAVTDRVLAGR